MTSDKSGKVTGPREIVDNYWHTINAHDFDRISTLLAPEFVAYNHLNKSTAASKDNFETEG